MMAPMSPVTQEFCERYADAFQEYLSGGAERSLEAAYELGRLALSERLSLMDVAEAHHNALAVAMQAGEAPGLADAAAAFFRESLATFEIAHRGFQEAHDIVRLEQAHAAQQGALAEAAAAINERLDPQYILDVITERARSIVDARGAKGEIRISRDEVLVSVSGEAAGGEDGRLCAPLVGRDRTEMGSLTVYGPRSSEASEAILVQLAEMGSTAIENAQRFQRERHIASTLQRSLLPGTIPELPGVDMAVGFWAAGDGVQVGGDFYDVFRTASGNWAVVIGDVCGKGPSAASLTALARYTIRAAGLHEHRPSAVLRLLNAAMLEQRTDGRFATVVCSYLTPMANGVHMVTASGGHPLPLILRTDGRVETLGTNGTLLGVVDEPVMADAGGDLEPGDTVVYYTDGVIEVRAGEREVFGAEDLAALLRRSAGMQPQALLERIETEVVRRSGGQLRDDVALLILRAQG
jgi:serine phosphatase RsbU (regulator of sigma subunit)